MRRALPGIPASASLCIGANHTDVVLNHRGLPGALRGLSAARRPASVDKPDESRRLGSPADLAEGQGLLLHNAGSLLRRRGVTQGPIQPLSRRHRSTEKRGGRFVDSGHFRPLETLQEMQQGRRLARACAPRRESGLTWSKPSVTSPQR